MPIESPQILIVDDARDIRDPLAQFLRKEGLRTRTAADASIARGILTEAAIHLVVLDVMMPGEDGLSLCRWISENRGPPVILLTAQIEDEKIIEGLNLGADDYVTKPFNPRELVARIRSVLRRRPPERAQPPTLSRRFAGHLHDPSMQQITLPDGQQVPLTASENRLLGVLLDHPGQVLSRDRLLDLLWGREAKAYDRAIDNTVSRLRRKIGDDARPVRLIATEWGGGYRLNATVEDQI